MTKQLFLCITLLFVFSNVNAQYIGGDGDGFAFDEFGSLGNEEPLPIELLNFYLTAKNTWVQINWATASEFNNHYFTVEKSINAFNWKEVSRVPAYGFSSNILQYSTIDYEPFVGISYYRLKQTDYDGTYSYSPIRTINFIPDSKDEFTVYPNPTVDLIKIIVNNENHEDYYVQILSIDYQVLIEEKNTSLIDLSHLQSGIYIVNVKSKQSVNYQKIVLFR